MFEILWALALKVTRFLLLEAMWCVAATAALERYAQSPVPFVVTEPVLDAAMAGDDLVVVSNSERRVLRSTPRGGTEVLMPATRPLVPGGEHLHVHGSRWWYGLAGTRDGSRGTYFVSDDGTSNTILATGVFLNLWVPLKTETPRALELSVDADHQPIAVEINASGPVRSWRLPMVLGRSTSAEILPDGRIALVAHHKDSARLTLLLLDADDQIDIISLGHKMLIQLATAVDSSGRLAIATATTDRRVDGTVVDPAHAAEPTWRELRRGIRLEGGASDLQVTPVSDGFMVGWINRSESPPQLEAGNLNGGGVFLSVGTLFDRGRNTFFALRNVEGEPVFTWDDGEHLVTRSLPPSISGYHLIERLPTWCKSLPSD
jgi:hypothetical protein